MTSPDDYAPRCHRRMCQIVSPRYERRLLAARGMANVTTSRPGLVAMTNAVSAQRVQESNAIRQQRALLLSSTVRPKMLAQARRRPLVQLASQPPTKIIVASAEHGSEGDGALTSPIYSTQAEVDTVAASDRTWKDVFDRTQTAAAFLQTAFNRASLDGMGMALQSTIHYLDEYNNALWDGQRMLYGDGDGVTFAPFSQFLDVIGHELTHGLIDHTLGLDYQDQAGALNEHLSDVFGSLLKQHSLQQSADQADWLIGQGLILKNGKPSKEALRSLAHPGTAFQQHPELGSDEQPAHMAFFYHGSDDNGGVHINSGIPNRAFYLLALMLGGNAWERAGSVWYNTITINRAKLSRQATFVDFARATALEAHELYGPQVSDVVKDAWSQVGVLALTIPVSLPTQADTKPLEQLYTRSAGQTQPVGTVLARDEMPVVMSRLTAARAAIIPEFMQSRVAAMRSGQNQSQMLENSALETSIRSRRPG